MSDRPLVTIGIPTYNRANGYLREALESALTQTYPNIEVVVADNCSTDNTAAVVAGYADRRIRYFRHDPGIRPNDNFNFCLQQAQGAYFLLLHDDDKIDADFIETCLRAADYRAGVGVIRTAVRIINPVGTVLDEGRNPLGEASLGEFFLGWIEGRTSIYLCGTLFDAEALKGIGGFRSRHNLFQDVGALARLAALGGRVEIDSVKASARQHSAKSTHVARVRAWCEDSVDLLGLLCELAPKHATELRSKGERFFAHINYSRASDIRPLSRRVAAYLLVYRFFGRRHLPPWRMVFASTALYRGLRHVKRRVMGRPAWVD